MAQQTKLGASGFISGVLNSYFSGQFQIIAKINIINIMNININQIMSDIVIPQYGNISFS
jgi:hypothetical protein